MGEQVTATYLAGKALDLSLISITARKAHSINAIGLCGRAKCLSSLLSCLLCDGVVAVALCELDSLAGSVAEVIEFGPSGFAASHGLNAQHVGRMQREDPLDAFVADHAAYGKSLVDAAALASYDGAAEYLRSHLFTLLDAAAHVDGIANFEVRNLFLEALAFNSVQQLGLHWYIPCTRY